MESFYKNKKILVTGASGFIGTNLILALRELGAEISCVVYSKKLKIPDHNLKIHKLDLTLKENCNKVCKNIDIVFMCAANSSGASVIEKAPLTHLTPNLVMNAFMLEAAYANKVSKFVFISSNTVYPVTNYPVKEEDINFNFFDKYHIVGWMKLFSEEMCKMYSSHINNPMQTLIIRPSNIYGPYDKFNLIKSKVIPSLIRKFVEKKNPITVWGNGEDIKDFIYIDDFIDALINASSLENFMGPVNIASSVSVTINDVIKELINITKFDNIKINYDLSMPTMIPVRLISNNLAKDKFDLNIRTTLNEGLRKTYSWYKSYYKNKDPDLEE